MAESEKITQQRNENSRDTGRNEITGMQEDRAQLSEGEILSGIARALEGQSSALYTASEEVLLYGASLLGNSLTDEYLGGGASGAELTVPPVMYGIGDDIPVNHIITSPPGLTSAEETEESIFRTEREGASYPNPAAILDRYEEYSGSESGQSAGQE